MSNGSCAANQPGCVWESALEPQRIGAGRIAAALQLRQPFTQVAERGLDAGAVRPEKSKKY